MERMRAQAVIRQATPEDARAIAAVHVDSWRTTYRGLLRDAYLQEWQRYAPLDRCRELLASLTPIWRLYLALQDRGQCGGVATFHLANDVPGDGVSGGHRLQATGATAAAPRSASPHDHVADLARPTVRTVIQVPVDHHSSADPRPDKNRQHRVVAVPGTELVLTQGGGAHVIFEEDRCVR